MADKNQGNSIVGGIGWKFCERIISQGISFLISLVLARLLSPDDYGLIALVLVFINLASVFITSGFATALIQKKDADETDFSTMFYCSLACSAVIYGVIFLISPLVASFYSNSKLSTVLRVYALQIPLSVYNSIQNAYISRKMIFKKSFFSTLISAIVSGGVGVFLAFSGFGVWALVFQSITLTVVSTLVLLVIVPWYPTLKFSVSSAKSMMKYGSRLLLADFSGTFFGEVRSLLIGRVYTSADLAFYTKGQQLPNLITGNLNTAVMTVLFPAFSNESDSYEKVKELTKRSIKLMSYIVFPALFGLAAVMPPLIDVLYTSKWSECVPYAQLLCIGLALGVIGTIPLQTLKGIGRSDTVLKLEFIKKPVYVLLLILGVYISVFAIAVTMVVYEIYGLAVNMLQIKKHIKYGIREQLSDVGPAFLAAGAMAIVVYFIPSVGGSLTTLAVKLLAGATLYIATSVIFKIDSFTEIKDILKRLLKRKG